MPAFGEVKIKSADNDIISKKLSSSPPSECFRNGVKDKNKENIDLTSLKGIANEIFGFNGWSHSITNQTVDFIDYSGGRYDIGVNALVKVTLKDGTFHEDIGYGVSKGLRCKGTSLCRARKLAVDAALRNALSAFGKGLGVVSSPVKILSGNRMQPLKKSKVTLSRVKRKLNYDGPAPLQLVSDKKKQPPCPATSPACNLIEHFSPVCGRSALLQRTGLYNEKNVTPGNVSGCLPTSPDCDMPTVPQSTPSNTLSTLIPILSKSSFQRDSGIENTSTSHFRCLRHDISFDMMDDKKSPTETALQDNDENLEPSED